VFQIPIAIANKGMEQTFTGDKSQTAMGHLHAIEDLCSLFKLTDVPHDHVKRKLLYLFLVMLAYILDLWILNAVLTEYY
jgi:hypothetical protein